MADDITGGDARDIARRRPELLTLVTGLLALALSVAAFVGDLPAFDPRWVLAGGAALLGSVLLVGSLRGRRGTRTGG